MILIFVLIEAVALAVFLPVFMIGAEADGVRKPPRRKRDE